jgi:hypothetical protein
VKKATVRSQSKYLYTILRRQRGHAGGRRRHLHDGEEHAEGEEEDPVDVVRDGVADLHAERKEEDASDDEEGNAKQDVADDPTVVESADDEDELRHNVDHGADSGPDQVGDEKAHGFEVGERGEALERGDGHKEADSPHNEAAEAKGLASVTFQREDPPKDSVACRPRQN